MKGHMNFTFESTGHLFSTKADVQLEGVSNTDKLVIVNNVLQALKIDIKNDVRMQDALEMCIKHNVWTNSSDEDLQEALKNILGGLFK